MKNIYQKLNDARLELQELNLKKTGRNIYSNYAYYELGDFLPSTLIIFGKIGLTSKLDIVRTELGEVANLTIINSENPIEREVFTSPTAEAEIGKKKDGSGGADPIQNLGGKITYMRRYLLMVALEIVEADIVESTKKQLTNEISEADLKLINETKTKEGLNTLYKELSKTYKIKLLAPIFSEAKEKLAQEESKA
jgi:hypothetical protein